MSTAMNRRAIVVSLLITSAVFSARGAAQPAPPNAARPDSASAPTLHLRSFTVIVRDYDEAKTWYTTRLGFQTLTDQRFGAQRFILVAPPGQRDVGIVLEKAVRDGPADPTMPGDYSDRLGKEV